MKTNTSTIIMRQYQVTELTTQLRRAIAGAFPTVVMVLGEVTDYSKASSGHVYFSLRDAGAKLKAVYFRTYMRPDSFLPKNGDKVSAIGELRVYEPEGSYQLVVRRVIYSTEGTFWQKFEETKKRLEDMGFFEAASKKPIPKYPKRVALLTAAGGAAVKDFIATAFKHGNFFDIDLWPIPVQGKDAAPAIVKAINKAGAMAERYQALVLTRGGGSLEDLAVFNEESVAHALKASLVPTISAIGHEQDISICDMVADLRAATPTAAAEALTVAYKESLSLLDSYSLRLLRLLRFHLENVSLSLDNLDRRLAASGAPKRINELRQRLNVLLSGLRNSTNALKSRQHKAELLRAELISSIERRCTKERHRLEILQQRLELSDPERLLSMGYALVFKDGKLIREAINTAAGDGIEIRMIDGRIAATVEDVAVDKR